MTQAPVCQKRRWNIFFNHFKAVFAKAAADLDL